MPIDSGNETDLLLAVMQNLAVAPDRKSVYELVRTAARKLASADGATFVLREGGYCHYVDEEAIEPLWRERRWPMSTCISGWVIQQREPVAITNVFEDPRIPSELYSSTFVRSMAMVPIRRHDPIGAIGFYWATERRVDSQELALFGILADAASAALERLEALKRLEAAQAESAPESSSEDVQLARMVRLCSWTGRVDQDGRWISIESYLKDRFGIHVTHAMSPDGAKLLKDLTQGSGTGDQPDADT